MKFRQQVKIFVRAQASAFIGGIVDYLVMIALSELLHIHYTISILISGIVGAVVNFSINRHWTYEAYEATIKSQLGKFIMVVLGSIVLKSAGTYLFTTLFRVDYKISRLIVDLVVSLGFNFLLQKHWVFKKAPDKALLEELT